MWRKIMSLPDQISTSISTTNTQTSNNVQTVQSVQSLEVAETDSNGVEMYNPNINNWDKPWLRTVISSENGSGSTYRLGTLSIIWSSLIIVGYLVYVTKTIPSNIMSLGYFSALLIAVTYSPAKLVEILKSYFSKKS